MSLNDHKKFNDAFAYNLLSDGSVNGNKEFSTKK